MERLFKEVTTLASDLKLHLSNWGLNPHATETQRRLWPGSNLSFALLGVDEPNCLRLLVGDGYDGGTVGSCTAAVAGRFFDDEGHLFPPDRDLVRLGLFCHLGFFRTLHLVVKNQWEEFVIKAKKASAPSSGGYVEALSKFEEGALARLLDGFRPGSGGRPSAEEIYLLFEEHGGLASQSGYDRPRFSALIDQMILSNVHYRGNSSAELESFIALQEREIALLNGVRHEEEYEFWLKKRCWLAARDELADRLLRREETRLRNFNVGMEWMALFGSRYLEVMEARLLCLKMERRIAIKRADPTLGEAEIEGRVKEGIEMDLASIEEAKGQVRRASLPGLMGTHGEPVSSEELESWRQEAKKIMREIWRLTHPDTLNGALTERQREKLRDYLEQTMRIREEESQLDMRAVSILKDILAGVEAIYDVMGIDLPPESVVRGDTLGDQIAWLEAEIEKIERQVREVMAEIHAMSLDPDVREKIASMAGEENRKATMLALEERKKELEEEFSNLREEYLRLAEPGGTA